MVGSMPAKTLGSAIAGAMKSAGWTQEELALRTGLSKEWIRKIVNGEIVPGPQALTLILLTLKQDPVPFLLELGYPPGRKLDTVERVSVAPFIGGHSRYGTGMLGVEIFIHHARAYLTRGFPFKAQKKASEVLEIIEEAWDTSDEFILDYQFEAEAIYLEAALQTLSDDEEIEALQPRCVALLDLAERIGEGAVARAHYRLADLYLQTRDYRASLDQIKQGLSNAQDAETSYELQRIQMGVFSILGDSRYQTSVHRLQDALEHDPNLTTHMLGCLSQAVGRCLAFLEGSRKGLALVKWGRPFCAKEPLLMILSYRSEGIAALCKSGGFNPGRAVRAAMEAIRLSNGRYQRMERHCQSIVLRARRNTPLENLAFLY